MRPRSFERGKGKYRHILRNFVLGFNEAALFRTRKGHKKQIKNRSFYVLQ